MCKIYKSLINLKVAINNKLIMKLVGGTRYPWVVIIARDRTHPVWCRVPEPHWLPELQYRIAGGWCRFFKKLCYNRFNALRGHKNEVE